MRIKSTDFFYLNQNSVSIINQLKLFCTFYFNVHIVNIYFPFPSGKTYFSFHASNAKKLIRQCNESKHNIGYDAHIISNNFILAFRSTVRPPTAELKMTMIGEWSCSISNNYTMMLPIKKMLIVPTL